MSMPSKSRGVSSTLNTPESSTDLVTLGLSVKLPGTADNRTYTLTGLEMHLYTEKKSAMGSHKVG